jgi:predicted ATPase/transcriptional regulator with XRE-family HTH domain
MMNGAVSFGQWVKERRLALDLTQVELGALVGCTRITIAKIEAGERRPSRQIVARLAEALQLAPDDRPRLIAWARDQAARPLPAPPGSLRPSPTAPLASSPDLAFAARQDNLPAARTSLVGRDRDVQAVRGLLWRAGVRLVTLTGPPGVGKTRLSLAVAAALRDDFAHGVCFVPLAPIRDPALVAPTIAGALGLQETAGQPVARQLAGYLRERQLLLLLDNFEQVLPAADLVGDLLDGAAQLKVLVTSRTVLRLYGEHQYTVPPLDLPDLQGSPPLDSSAPAALTLFVQRAQAVGNFALTPDNASAIARICKGLDGLPLAIELAAARSKILSPASMLAQLERRLALLVEGPRDHPVRQRTLRDALAWSYDLLDPAEKTLFRRLGVFVGGFLEDAAAAVCADVAPEPPVLPGGAVGPLIESLVDKSLLWPGDAEKPYRMLETIREYALEQLAACDEAALGQRRHAEYYLALAEAAAPELNGPGQAAWLERLEWEHANLRAALEWMLAQEDPALALRLAGVLWRLWEKHGHWSEGRRWLARVLEHGQGAPARLCEAALNGAGVLAYRQGDYAQATRLYEASLAARRELGDRRGMGATLNNLSLVAYDQGDYARATALCEEALALFREIGLARGLAAALDNLGLTAYAQGDYGRAAALCEESLALRRREGDAQWTAISLNVLGMVAREQGEYARAAERHAESLSLFTLLGDGWGRAEVLGNLGHLALAQGAYDTAREHYCASLLLFQELSNRNGIARDLEGLAAVAAATGAMEQAALLAGAADALRAGAAIPRPMAERLRYERTLTTVRAGLPDMTFRAAMAAGGLLPMSQIVQEALRGSRQGGGGWT